MKSAMQTLVEEFDNQDPNRKYTAQEVVNYAVELLEKEKQQIIEAYNQGYRDGETTGVTIDKKDVSKCADAKIYFTETYNTQQV